MEIKEPRFQKGQKVMYEGNLYIVVEISSYSFSYNEYLYRIEDDVKQCVKSEEELEPYVEKPKTIWDVKEGDEFYYIAFDGDILSGKWVDAIEYRESGNVFLTLQEAESELERRKIEAEMLRLGGRRYFKKGESNWYIRYNFYTDSVDVDYNMYDSYGRGIIYFDSEEKAKEIIKTISEDKIRKYIFGAD